MKQTLPPCAIGFLYLNSILWWRLVYGYTNTRTLIKSCDCHHNPQHSIYILYFCCLFPQTRVRKTTRLHDILVWKWMKRRKKVYRKSFTFRIYSVAGRCVETQNNFFFMLERVSYLNIWEIWMRLWGASVNNTQWKFET